MSETNTIIDTRAIDTYQEAYDRLQNRFGGQIQVVKSELITDFQDPNELVSGIDAVGFRDISVKASELSPLVGRVVLYPNRIERCYQPAVITRTKDGRKLQMTVLGQPYDPEVGVSEGILFELGLKNDTQQPTFGSHTAAGGYESGHFAPAMIGAKSVDARNNIITLGDKGTHRVGAHDGGVPEKMMKEGLMGGTPMLTRELSLDNPHPIPLAWHPRLESPHGLMVARYTGPTNPIELMLGAASKALGDQAVDQVGELVDAAIRGR